MSDRVREVLLERILDGTYPPGHRLKELAVAEELGTSQGPVREALHELRALRVVTVEPYRGTRVREVGEAEMRGAVEVRAVLEQFAAERAVDQAPDLLDRLDAEVEGMRTAAADGDLERFARYDNAFHECIVTAAGNEALLRSWKSLGVEARIRILLDRREIELERLAEAHVPIREALAAGDSAEAGRLLRSHPGSFYWPDEEDARA